MYELQGVPRQAANYSFFEKRKKKVHENILLFIITAISVCL